MGKVTRICLTGGPCGGKSTGLSVIEQELTNKGYKVLVVEEMATNLINSGITVSNVGIIDFQRALVKLQYERNKMYDELADKIARAEDKDVIIVYDRGIPDCKGFMTDEEYTKVLSLYNFNEIRVRDYYDGVFSLVTAADGAREFYTCENNTARTETPEQAIERDRQCVRAWTGHSHLRIIGNEGTFEDKIAHLMKEIYSLIGIPAPIEIEKKFLIRKPDFNKLKEKYTCTTVEILQTYLKQLEDGVERRVRQRGANGVYSFYYTEKKQLDEMSRIETEKKITEQEYIRLLTEANTELHQIRKNRTCLVYQNQYIEIDEYPFWNNEAMMEIELTDKNDMITIPSELEVINDVTEDNDFKNKSLAITLGVIE